MTKNPDFCLKIKILDKTYNNFISNNFLFLLLIKLEKMGVVKEFKEFAFKGNVVDLAIAVIIGAAFGKIVTSFVADVITPLLLNPALKAAGVSRIELLSWNSVMYGNFFSAVLSFLIIAIVLFLVIKGINKMKGPKEILAPAGPTKEEQLLTEIRDLLKK